VSGWLASSLHREENPEKEATWNPTLRKTKGGAPGLKHRRTRPYSPQTNGKAERFIQTALREWAYATHWPDSDQRNLCLAPWTEYYNHARPHGSLNYQPPISRSEPGTTS
jgi:transposase InsO family protein